MNTWNNMIKRIFHKIFMSFDLRPSVPKDKEMEDLMDIIIELKFDGVSKDKENIRKDFYKLGSDFKKSTLEAKRRLEKEECLL